MSHSVKPFAGAGLGLISTLVLISTVSAQDAASPAKAASPPPAESAARAMPRPEDLNPAVDTSATAPSQGEPPAAGRETVKASPSASKPASAAPPSPATPASAKAAGARGGRAIDRLDLETTEITGNRELPKVLYIVPWKRSDLGDLVGKPVNSLLDEVLEPVDRDVFRRENRYYRALQQDSADTAAPAAPK